MEGKARFVFPIMATAMRRATAGIIALIEGA